MHPMACGETQSASGDDGEFDSSKLVAYGKPELTHWCSQHCQKQPAGKPLRTPINKERDVKKFVYLHFGFEKPTPEIMKAWGAWFESISDKMVDQGGFSGGREISKSGTRDLPMNMESITGYNVIEAESLDAAEKLAQSNPFIASIRIYEVRSM